MKSKPPPTIVARCGCLKCADAELVRELLPIVSRVLKYAAEDRMVTPGVTRLRRALDELGGVVAREDEEAHHE